MIVENTPQNQNEFDSYLIETYPFMCDHRANTLARMVEKMVSRKTCSLFRKIPLHYYPLDHCVDFVTKHNTPALISHYSLHKPTCEEDISDLFITELLVDTNDYIPEYLRIEPSRLYNAQTVGILHAIKSFRSHFASAYLTKTLLPKADLWLLIDATSEKNKIFILD